MAIMKIKKDNTIYFLPLGDVANYDPNNEIYIGDGDMPDGASVQFIIDADQRIGSDMLGYLTPEMYGAQGGQQDDTNAIQECVNAAIALKKSVLFTQDYQISDTILIEDGNNYNSKGLLIEGNNRIIKITENASVFKIIGSGITIQNLKCTYSYNQFPDYPYEDKKDNYSSSMIVLESGVRNIEDKKSIYVSFNNTFINVVLQAPDLSFKNQFLYNNAGFELLIANGEKNYEPYIYSNKFIGCFCHRLGTAILCNGPEPLEDGEPTHLGINGNSFEINSWGCDHYLGGNLGPEGSDFKGIVQVTQVKKDSENKSLNEYVITNPGRFNEFSAMFYDVNFNNDGIYQKLAENLGDFNIYTKPVSRYAVKNPEHARYSTYDNYSNMYHTTPFAFDVVFNPNIMHSFPIRNSFNGIENISMKCENITISDEWDSKYGTTTNGIPDNVAYLFHDEYQGRKTPILQFHENGKVSFTFGTPEIQQMYLYILFSGYLGDIDSVSLKSNTTGQISEGLVFNNSNRTYAMVSIGTQTSASTSYTLEITASPNEGADQKNIMIAQITGAMYSIYDGII